MQLEYSGEIKSGKLLLRDQNKFQRDIAVMKDCQIEILIKKKYDRRSDGQNKYYWGVVIPRIQSGLRDMHGEIYDSEEVHDFLKGKFNLTEIVNPETSEVIQFPQSTTKLDIKSFAEYLDKCKNFAIEFLNVDIDADDYQKRPAKPLGNEENNFNQPPPTLE